MLRGRLLRPKNELCDAVAWRAARPDLGPIPAPLAANRDWVAETALTAETWGRVGLRSFRSYRSGGPNKGAHLPAADWATAPRGADGLVTRFCSLRRRIRERLCAEVHALLAPQTSVSG